ncbi:MAG: hypothetical protein ABWY55_08545 [Microbacterium sp.]
MTRTRQGAAGVRSHPSRVVAATVALLLTGVLAGCGAIPSDPEGSLDRITDGVLRAGASPSGTLVVVVDDGDVTGPLADLVEGFAEDRGARVEWTVDSEEDLVDGLEAGDLDLAIGGMTDATPWGERVSVTRGYDAIPGSSGPVVVLLPLGENALQSALESYLDEEVGG